MKKIITILTLVLSTATFAAKIKVDCDNKIFAGEDGGSALISQALLRNNIRPAASNGLGSYFIDISSSRDVNASFGIAACTTYTNVSFHVAINDEWFLADSWSDQKTYFHTYNVLGSYLDYNSHCGPYPSVSVTSEYTLDKIIKDHCNEASEE